MTGRPVKRSLTLRGHRTSVSLEEPFWQAFRAIAAAEGKPLNALAAEIDAARLAWRGRRPAPEAASLGAAVARAAERGDPLPVRMVDRWCGRVTRAVAEEVARLGLGDRPAVVVYGGLLEASPWLGERIRDAVLGGAPHARLLALLVEPAEGAADLAIDAWKGHAVAGWGFTPRR